MGARIPIDQEKLAEFCRKHHIRKLAFFGSVLRDDFRPDSDVDVLYELEPGHRIGGYFDLIHVEDELSGLLQGHPVEMVEPRYLNRWIKDQVLSEAQVQYGKN
jgi:predicted nucleotidyltransferase